MAKSLVPHGAQWVVCGLHLPHLPERQCCVPGKSQMSASQIWTVTCCVVFHALLTLSGPHTHHL